MYYFKATSVIDDGVSFEDYFEAGPDGVLLRVVSYDGRRWWASLRDHADDGDEVHLRDFDLANAITGDEFERVWRMALAKRSAEPV
jgi:hypothetical protein